MGRRSRFSVCRRDFGDARGAVLRRRRGRAGRLVHALEAFGQEVQFGLPEAELFERRDGGDHVVAVGAGPAVTLPHVVQLLIEREPPGILRMPAIDHVAERRNPLLRARRAARPTGRSPDRPWWPARGRADRRRSRPACWPPLGTPCRGRRRPGRAPAPGRAAPACRGARTNRRTAPDGRRRAGLLRARRSRSPAARSASHSRTPRGRRRKGPESGPWQAQPYRQILAG